jgi:hypothetical protein
MNIFKVGDKVRCIGKGTLQVYTVSSDDVFTVITTGYPNNYNWIELEGEDGKWIFTRDEECELVTIPEFKVGDRVALKRKYLSQAYGFKEDQIFMVIECYDTHTTIKESISGNHPEQVFTLHNNELKLMSVPEFKLGDRVRLRCEYFRKRYDLEEDEVFIVLFSNRDCTTIQINNAPHSGDGRLVLPTTVFELADTEVLFWDKTASILQSEDVCTCPTLLNGHHEGCGFRLKKE